MLLGLGMNSAIMAEVNKLDKKKPNLLIIHTNEQTFKSISSYDNSWGDLQTPNIDFLANGGARFENFYTNHPLCTPSRAALLTGKYAQKSNVFYNDLLLKEGTQTLGHIMKDRGFVTGYSGKFHLVGGILPGFSPPRKFGFSNNRYMFNSFPLKNVTIGETGLLKGSSEVGDETSYSTDFFKDRTIEFIEKNKDKSWCYMVGFSDPREPMVCRSPYDTMYKAEDMKVPATFLLPKEATSNWKPRLRESTNQTATEYLKAHKAKYYGIIKLIDDSVGKIIESLKRNGMLENTVIVFTTDQGDMMGEFSRYDKEIFHNSAAKIPFIVYYPSQIKPKTVVRDVVSNIDFIPTILDIMDIPFDGREFDGKSAAAFLKGETNRHWRNAAYLSLRKEVAVVTKRFKLILRSGREPCLIDLVNDPDEYKNVIHNQEHRKEVKLLANDLRSYLEYMHDPNWTNQLQQVMNWRFEQYQTYRSQESQKGRWPQHNWKNELADQLDEILNMGSKDIKGGLIGHWPLDGDFKDVSGNGYHGTVSEDPLKFVEGKHGKAVDFQGASIINCGNVPLGTNGQLTVALWVKPNRIKQPFAGFVQKQNTDYSERAFWIGQHPQDGYLAWAQFTPTNAKGTQLKSSKAVLKNDEWTHVALTMDGAYQRIYINGKLDATSPKRSSGIMDGGDNLRFGRVENTPGGRYSGLMDDVWIYNKALSENELIKLMEKIAPTK